MSAIFSFISNLEGLRKNGDEDISDARITSVEFETAEQLEERLPMLDGGEIMYPVEAEALVSIQTGPTTV